MESSFHQGSGKLSAKEIRESLSIYPDARFRIPKFILESISLTLEVFLHTRIGESYLSIYKAIAGSVFIFLTLLFAIFGFSVSLHPDVTQIGGISLFKSFIESALAFEWRQAFEKLGRLVLALRDPETRIDVLGPVQIMVVIYSLAVNLHLLLNFVAKHRKRPRLWHPRSSGEPWIIWDWVYRIGHYFNFKVDLVKQICEPLFCFLLASYLGSRDSGLPEEWHFIVAWIKLGSLALVLRASFENRAKNKLALDRLANEFDARAFELQNTLYARDGDSEIFVEAVGRQR